MIELRRVLLMVVLGIGVTLLVREYFHPKVSVAIVDHQQETPLVKSDLSTSPVQLAKGPKSVLIAGREPHVSTAPVGQLHRGMKLRPLVKAMPLIHEARAQVRANPHETPQALLAFAYVLAQRLGPALKSEAAAAEFFPDLQACALAEVASTLASARGLCLVNAKKVAAQFPSLSREFEDLTARADSEALQLASRLD